MGLKVRRAHREELPGLQVLREAVRGAGSARGRIRLDLEMGADPTLVHLQTHDPDGVLVVLDRDETLGFAAAHVRSRQWVLSDLWVLPQHQGRGAGGLLLRKAMAYGERSGARERLALAPVEPAIQAVLLRAGLGPLQPVYLVRLEREAARRVGSALAGLLPGQDVTDDFLKLRGHADLDRLDGLVRGIRRQVDHTHWVKERGLELAFVRQGNRVAAYGYGGQGQVGPVAGATRDAALAALGWSLRAAARNVESVEVQVPAPFAEALEALLDGGGRIVGTSLLYGAEGRPKADRWIPGPPSLP